MASRAWAVFAVLVAQAAQVWFVLWLQNWWGPGIDAGHPPPVAVSTALNLLLVAGFGTLHSVMARPAFKVAWTRVVPPSLERATYVGVAGATLLALCALWQPLPQPVWDVASAPFRIALYGVFFAGLGIILWAIQAIDPLHFHGLRQAFSGRVSEPPFAMRGPYRIVRHPIQTGLVVMLWSTPTMSIGHLMFALAMTGYSIGATLLMEERDLRRQVGGAYDDYRRRVPALIPFWPMRR